MGGRSLSEEFYRSIGVASSHLFRVALLTQNHSATSNTSPMGSIPPRHLIKYNITPTDEGVLLKIWEPAERNETRVKPFLFMLKYRLSSEREARDFLANYLSFY